MFICFNIPHIFNKSDSDGTLHKIRVNLLRIENWQSAQITEGMDKFLVSANSVTT